MRPVVFAILIAAALHGQSKQADVDRIFASFNTHTPGCAVGVSYQGKVALESGYGMADLERHVAVTPATVFESGSVAKQFTSMALLLLAQQGKISVDDPMRKYLPELPDYGTPLTIRQVMSHVSGLREWRLIASFAGKPEGVFVLDNKDLLRFASMQRGLNFTPGSQYSYTNTGFNIMTILIERALGNGKTFQDFTRESIFEPLGMTHSRWRDDFHAVVPDRALAYTNTNGTWIQDTPVEDIIGAGGMLTTVGDWLLWNENFAHPKVGGPEVVKEQQTPAVLSNGKTISYAKGLTINTVDGLREVSHGGSTGGYRTWLGRYPDQGVSIAVMCNSAQANPTQLGRDTARLWTGAKPAPKPTAFPVDSAVLEKLAGMYRDTRNNAVVEFRASNGKLSRGRGEALVAVAADRFSAGEAEYIFTGDRVRQTGPDGEILYERVEPAHPSPSELGAFAGEYNSPETGSTVKIAQEGSELKLILPARAPAPLRPTFRDAFGMQRGPASAIRFVRDSAGSVTGFTVSDDRAWNIRFTRGSGSTSSRER